MRLVDFVNAHLDVPAPAAPLVRWVGPEPAASLPPDEVVDGARVEVLAAELTELAAPVPGDGCTVLRLREATDEAEQLVRVLHEAEVGAQVVLLQPWFHADARTARVLDALRGHGWQVLFEVDLNDAYELAALSALSARRTARRTPGRGTTALSFEQEADPRGPAAGQVRELRAAVAELSRRLLSERAESSGLRRRLADAEDALLDARLQLRELRHSASVQLGFALTDVARHPAAGLRKLPQRMRAARSAAPGPRPSAAASSGAQPAPWVRMRTFPLAMPSRPAAFPGPARKERLELDVLYRLYIPLRLQRDGLAGYEPETLAWYLALCDHAGPGDVWDVGANVGLFALLARAYTDRTVVGFEPTPELMRWARRIAAANDLDYTYAQVAASDALGTATFFLSDSTDSSNSLAAGFRDSSAQLDVLTLPLDEYAARTGSFPAVLKIDTETTEPAVVRGAAEVIEKHRPWILCEVLAVTDAHSIRDQLAPLGYSFFHVTEELPLQPTDVLEGDASGEFYMFLLAPEPPDETLWRRVAAWREAIAACAPLTPRT